ncbi:MAG: hypothetical protein ACREXR_02910 [Gammaproteobacteria bacterium]
MTENNSITQSPQPSWTINDFFEATTFTGSLYSTAWRTISMIEIFRANRIVRRAIVGCVLLLCGCGDAYPPGSEHLYRPITDVLIRQGRCIEVQDCNDKEFVFAEGGSGGGLHFSIYDSKDSITEDEIILGVAEAKKKNKISYVVTLSFYTQTKAMSLADASSAERIEKIK